MAVVTVTFDGTRVVDASVTTNWVAASSTPTVETDFFYQGAGCISGAIKTAEIGFYYRQVGITHNMTTPRVVLFKVTATNKDALDGNGLTLEIGTGTRTAYHRYYVFSATSYPIAGGFQIIPIDPNIAAYRSASVGTPTLTVIDFFGVQADFSAISKAPNLGCDAIDYITSGTGLTLVGGDGADPDGTFTSLITTDEGTVANRWGVVTTRGGVLYITGTLQIGTATATVFIDSNKVIVFNDGRFGTGFCGIKINASNASSVFTISSTVFRGLGIQGANDTRPDYAVTGTVSTVSLTSNNFNTFRNMVLTSSCTATACSFIGGLLITQASSTLTNCTFASQTTGAGIALILSNNPGLISTSSFNLSGGVGHALEMNTAGTYNFSGNTFVSYGAINSTSAAVYNNVAPTTAASYSEANQDATTSLNTGATVGAAQSFAGNNGILSSCRFFLKKTGSPTGTAVCRIYAHSGTFGTSSIPTGVALATSTTTDVSALTGSYVLTEFKFTGSSNITLSTGTNYTLSIEYTGGSGGNTLDVGRDASAPGASGNFATFNGSVWTAVNTSDACFYLYTGGAITLNVTNSGGTPTFRNALGCSTTINNAVTLEITIKDSTGAAIENARVAIYKLSDNVEISNSLSNVSGIVTSSYAYSSNESIYIRVRKTSPGPTRYINNDSSGTITATGFSATITLLNDIIALA